MANAQARRTMPGPLEVVEIQRTFLREVGSVFWFIVNTFQESMERVQQGRAPFRAASFFRETVRAGVDSVPLVGLVCFFLGLTMALLTGYQLQRLGTERLVPGLVAIAFTRELGPLLTGIMLAARIGAAFTAELGTMEVNEEVEAIEAMGISPLRFLVASRPASVPQPLRASSPQLRPSSVSIRSLTSSTSPFSHECADSCCCRTARCPFAV